MIPVRLKMRNFMPYRGDTPELSFAGIHTACISGENGSGKSSIIDAITWALWGKARARGDDELVHQGECEMEVEFEFTLGEELYRVIRKHTLPKSRRASGRGSLDLFIQSGTGFIPLTADTKTQTEQKIAALLHMDYDTFVNSAFLRQGHADQFSRQTPSRRKEVLASILGLDIYDAYEARARDRARQAEQEKLRLNVSIGEMAAELTQKAEVADDVAKAEAELKEMAKIMAESEGRLSALRARRQELGALEARRQELEEAMSRHEADLAAWQGSRAECADRIAEYQKLVAQQADIEAGYQKLEAARQLADEMDHQASRLYQLRERHNQLEQSFLKAQAELNASYKVIEERVARLEEKAARLSALRQEMTALQPQRKELREAQSSVAAERTAARQSSESLARTGAEIDSLWLEVRRIQEKLSLLLDSSDGARCPLCESELGEERLCLVRDKLEQEAASIKAQAAKLEQERQAENGRVAQANSELELRDARLKEENDALVSDMARLNEAIKEATTASEQLKNEQESLARIAESLASRDYATDTLTRLAEAEAAISAINYDEKRHQALKAELKELEAYHNLKRSLDDAMRLLPETRNKLALAEKTIKDVQKRQASDTAARDGLLARLAGLPQLEEELKQAEEEQRGHAERHLQAQQRLGGLRERLGYLEGLEEKLKEKRQALAQATRRQETYDELALAFGKKGIQAMLIETTLPEIEDEANRLLGRMSDGRMSVTIESQKETKKGDVAETLDIRIGDELGTRDYEMFSGGEAFRIDFAIRIALSRLLARRAGAPLPTLIIDEGFGTQDTEGIDKLKEAITSIQDEFKKIIVITHIEELKDAFPTRINVVKTEGGSRIEVNQG